MLTIQNNNAAKLSTAQVYSTNGQLIKSFSLDKGVKSSTIDLSAFEKGVYLIKINSDKESTSVKVIKK